MKRLSHLMLLSCLGGLVSCNQATATEVTAIELNRTTQHLSEGETFQLEIAKMDGGPKSVVYWSSDEKVASVSETGLITAKKAGEAKILAFVDQQKAVCLVTVKAKPTAKTVDVRKGNFQAKVTGPYFDINETFDSPAELYSQIDNGVSNADMLLPFGQAEGEKAKANVAFLSKLSASFSYPELSASYAALAEAEPSVLAKERAHAGIADKPYFALTYQDGETETSRFYRKPDVSSSALSTLIRLYSLSSFSPASLIGFDWKSVLSLVAKDGEFPTGKDKENLSEYGSLAGDFFAAFSVGFLLKSSQTETEDRYSFTLSEEGLPAMSSFLVKHKDTLHLKEDFTLTDFDFSFIYPRKKNTLTGLSLSVTFQAKEASNTFVASLSLAEASEEGPADYFTKLKESRKKW